MSSNRIISFKNLSTMLKGGKYIALAIATKIDKWNRSKSAAITNALDF